MYCTNCGTLRPESRPRFCRACGVEYDTTAPTEAIRYEPPADPWSGYHQPGVPPEPGPQLQSGWGYGDYANPPGGFDQGPTGPVQPWDHGQPVWAPQPAGPAWQPTAGSRRPLLTVILAVAALVLGLTIGYLAISAIYPAS